MLKIRDDVNLKELEKFGFEWQFESMYIPERYCFEKEDKCIVFADSRIIAYISRSNCKELNVLFDLIQAGLVEKVVEE